MTTVWTDKNKATGTSWTPSPSPAYLRYDSGYAYDFPNAVFDGAINTWSDIAKPISGIGLWSSASFPWQDLLPWQIGVTSGWIDIQKAT